MFTDSDTLVPMSSNMIGNIYFDEKNKMTSEWMLCVETQSKIHRKSAFKHTSIRQRTQNICDIIKDKPV